jgi:16S rRNA (adenine(1408)-N(1))-methyltransferase
MRMVEGSRVVQGHAKWREQVLASGRRVVVDVGAGDGRWAYEMARRDPGALFLALDPDADALKEYAYRASRKPSRGGVENAAFVVASIEDPPPEVQGVADEVHVLLPWAALLRGLLRPEPAVLRGLASLLKPGGEVRLVLTYDATHDHGAEVDADIGSLNPATIERLSEPYSECGIQIEGARELGLDESLAIPSNWGRRLLHGRARPVYEVRARRH